MHLKARMTGYVRAVALVSIVAFASACGSSSSPSAPSPGSGSGGSTSGANVTVTIQGNNGSQSYNPSPVSMSVGQTIAWHNADSITHTATQDSSGFNTGNVSAGATSSPITMNTRGTFTYHCTIHPGMIGTVNVQ